MGIKSWFKNFFALISLILANVWVQRVLLIIVLVSVNIFAAKFFGYGLWPTLVITGFFSIFWYKHRNLDDKYLLAVPSLIVFIITSIIYYLGIQIGLENIINDVIILGAWHLVFVCFFVGVAIGFGSLTAFRRKNKRKILKENPS
jgi:hypothetical protein